MLGVALLVALLWWISARPPRGHPVAEREDPPGVGGGPQEGPEPPPKHAVEARDRPRRGAPEAPSEPAPTEGSGPEGTVRGFPERMPSPPPRLASSPPEGRGRWTPDLAVGTCALYFRGHSKVGSAATWWCRHNDDPETLDAATAEAFRRLFGDHLEPGALTPEARSGNADARVEAPHGGPRVSWGHRPGGWVRFTIFQPSGFYEARLLHALGFTLVP